MSGNTLLDLSRLANRLVDSDDAREVMEAAVLYRLMGCMGSEGDSSLRELFEFCAEKSGVRGERKPTND